MTAATPDTPRDPGIAAVVKRAYRAFRELQDPAARLQVVISTAAEIERIGDDGSDAMGDVIEVATTTHGLDADAVQAAWAEGINRALGARAEAQTEAPSKAKPAIKPNGRDGEHEKPLPRLLSKRDFLAGFVPPD
jgi:hypothetical protein